MLWFYQTWLSLRAPVALVCAIIPLVKITLACWIVCLCININECLNHQTHNAELFCFVMCKQSHECKNCKLYIVQCTIFVHVPVGIYSTYYVHLFIFNSRVTEGHTRVKRLLDWFYFYKRPFFPSKQLDELLSFYTHILHMQNLVVVRVVS
jgi:hypothetical protein